jgi:hypothetical protein
MANDSMRGGPRGSSDQEAFVGPTIMQFVGDSGATVAGGTLFVKATAADDGLLTNAHFGCDWQVIEVRVCVETTFATNDIAIDIGNNADPNGIVAAGATGSVTSAARTEHVIALNGVAPTATFGVTNGPLFLTVPTSAGAGVYSVSVLAKPTSGTYFSN